MIRVRPDHANALRRCAFPERRNDMSVLDLQQLPTTAAETQTLGSTISNAC